LAGLLNLMQHKAMPVCIEKTFEALFTFVQGLINTEEHRAVREELDEESLQWYKSLFSTNALYAEFQPTNNHYSTYFPAKNYR
jgi:hypothetical protein